jgi:phosphate transport system permease protein
MRLSGDGIAKGLFGVCAAASAVITSLVFLFMIVLALPVFRGGGALCVWIHPWNPYQGLYGIWPMITGTLGIALLATLFSLPLSLGTAFVISGLGGTRIRKLLGGVVRFMTGIPTVIYGFVGVFLLVPLIRENAGGPGMCVLSASLMLAILISPTMVLFFSDSFASVDPSYLHASKALGADSIQQILYVMLPQSMSGMISGVVLGLGRALGDTLIALMLAGNAIEVPSSPVSPARTLTAHIALVRAADIDSLEFRSIFACGIALYVFTSVAALSVRIIRRGRNGNR